MFQCERVVLTSSFTAPGSYRVCVCAHLSVRSRAFLSSPNRFNRFSVLGCDKGFTFLETQGRVTSETLIYDRKNVYILLFLSIHTKQTQEMMYRDRK